MIKYCASCEVATDECVLRYVGASVGGLDSVQLFDVHSSCIFKDLETDYPVCFYRKRKKIRVCTRAFVRAHRIPTVEPVARCTVVLLSAPQNRDFLIPCNW
jgi:hypothetical protein